MSDLFGNLFDGDNGSDDDNSSESMNQQFDSLSQTEVQNLGRAARRKLRYMPRTLFEGRSVSNFVGLTNQGATCYMNALIQTMYLTPEFRQGFYRLSSEDLYIESQSVETEILSDILDSKANREKIIRDALNPPKEVEISDNLGNSSTPQDDLNNDDITPKGSLFSAVDPPDINIPNGFVDDAPPPPPLPGDMASSKIPVTDIPRVDPDPDEYAYLTMMGFTELQMECAFHKFPHLGSNQRRIDWIFSPAGQHAVEERKIELAAKASSDSVATDAVPEESSTPTEPVPATPVESPLATPSDSPGSSRPVSPRLSKQERALNRRKKRMKIPVQMQKLFSTLQLADQKAIPTKDLTDSFGWSAGQARTQHDVHELNRKLFHIFEEALKKSPQKDLIPSLYTGKLINRINCQSCPYSSVREEEFQDISVVIKNKRSLQESLSEFSEYELLSHPNQYSCPTCDKKVDALKGVAFKEVPPILTIALRRFEYDWATDKREKLSNTHTFPLLLDMNPFMDTNIDSQVATFFQQWKASGAEGPRPRPPAPTIDDGVDEFLAQWDLEHPENDESISLPNETRSTVESGSPSPNPTPVPNETTTADTLEQAKRKVLEQKDIQLREASLFHIPNDISTSQHIYDLFSVIIHQGGAYGGHYHAYINDPLNEGVYSCPHVEKEGLIQTRWFDFNDSDVSQIHASTIAEQFGGYRGECAYLLVYRQRDSPKLTTTDIPVPPPIFSKPLVIRNQMMAEERKFYEDSMNDIDIWVHFTDEFHIFDDLLYHNSLKNTAVPKTGSDAEFTPENITLDGRKTIRDLRQLISKLDLSRSIGAASSITESGEEEGTATENGKSAQTDIPYSLSEILIKNGRVTIKQSFDDFTDDLPLSKAGVTDLTRILIWDGKHIAGQEWVPGTSGKVTLTCYCFHPKVSITDSVIRPAAIVTLSFPVTKTVRDLKRIIHSYDPRPNGICVIPAHAADIHLSTYGLEGPIPIIDDALTLNELNLSNGSKIAIEPYEYVRTNNSMAILHAEQVVNDVTIHVNYNAISFSIFCPVTSTLLSLKSLALSHLKSLSPLPEVESLTLSTTRLARFHLDTIGEPYSDEELLLREVGLFDNSAVAIEQGSPPPALLQLRCHVIQSGKLQKDSKGSTITYHFGVPKWLATPDLPRETFQNRLLNKKDPRIEDLNDADFRHSTPMFVVRQEIAKMVNMPLNNCRLRLSDLFGKPYTLISDEHWASLESLTIQENSLLYLEEGKPPYPGQISIKILPFITEAHTDIPIEAEVETVSSVIKAGTDAGSEAKKPTIPSVVEPAWVHQLRDLTIKTQSPPAAESTPTPSVEENGIVTPTPAAESAPPPPPPRLLTKKPNHIPLDTLPDPTEYSIDISQFRSIWQLKCVIYSFFKRNSNLLPAGDASRLYSPHQMTIWDSARRSLKRLSQTLKSAHIRQDTEVNVQIELPTAVPDSIVPWKMEGEIDSQEPHDFPSFLPLRNQNSLTLFIQLRNPETDSFSISKPFLFNPNTKYPSYNQLMKGLSLFLNIPIDEMVVAKWFRFRYYYRILTPFPYAPDSGNVQSSRRKKKKAGEKNRTAKKGRPRRNGPPKSKFDITSKSNDIPKGKSSSLVQDLLEPPLPGHLRGKPYFLRDGEVLVVWNLSNNRDLSIQDLFKFLQTSRKKSGKYRGGKPSSSSSKGRRYVGREAQLEFDFDFSSSDDEEEDD